MKQPLWGYMEGYFGRLLTWPQRGELLSVMAAQGLGTWVYAPKEDPLHRRLWRQPYDAEWCRNFSAFCERAASLDVRVVAAVSPGQDIRFADPNETHLLVAKYRQLLEAGANSAALLFDDLPMAPERADADNARQQAALAVAVLNELNLPANQLSLCPTQYCTQQTPKGVGQSAYLQTLVEQLPQAVCLFWTGRQVIARSLSAPDTADIAALFGDRLLFWDNLYANDWAPRRLIICPYHNRDRAAPLLLNPTGLPQTDSLYLRLLGHHARGEKPEAALQQVLQQAGVPPGFEQIAWLFALDDAHLPDIGDTKAIQALCRTLEQWAFGGWASPLQREWYPFLQGCLQDLRLCLQIAEGRLGDATLHRAMRGLPQPLRLLLHNNIAGGDAADE